MQYFGVALAGRLDEALSMAFGRLLRVTASVCRVRIFSSELGIDELPVWREALLGPSDLLGRICALPQSFPGFRSCRRCLSIRGGGVPGWDSEGYGENPYRAPQQPPYAEQLPDTRYLADSPFVGDARYHRADVTQSHGRANGIRATRIYGHRPTIPPPRQGADMTFGVRTRSGIGMPPLGAIATDFVP